MRRRCSTGSRPRSTKGLAQLRDVPLLTVSAKTGKGIDTILKVAFELREAWSRRVPTGELNRWFEAAIEANPPPAPKGQRIKLRYITQVKSRPPTFVVFGNRTDELPESYRRYLVNAMRRDLELGPVPLRLDFRGRTQSIRPRAAAKANFTLFRLSGEVGPRPSDPALEEQHGDRRGSGHRRLGAFREEPGRARAGLHPHPQLFQGGRRQVGRPDRAGDARAEYDRAGASGAHPQGRSAPARRRAAGQDRRADRNDRALLRREPAAFPTSWCPRWSSCARCSTRRSSCSTRRPIRW